MARGLILGATLLSLTGSLFAALSAWLPMWLAFRTEVEERMCFEGEGVWWSGWRWGQDLPSVGLRCGGGGDTAGRSSWAAYCGPDPNPRLNDRDPVDFAEGMCTATTRAKVTSGVAFGLAVVAVVVGCVMETVPLDSRREVAWALTGMGACLLCIATSVATFVIMSTSPLFSEAHIAALSKESAGIPFSSYFSCSFQMPLHSIWRLLLPGALECIFPGPSYVCNLLIILIMGLAAAFFAISAYHVYTKKLHHVMDVGHFHLESEEDKGRKQRVYSLFGAAARRFSRLSPGMRNVLIVVVPFLVMLSNAVVWAGFLMTGVQIIVGATVDIAWEDSSITAPMVFPPLLSHDEPASSLDLLSAIADLPLPVLLSHTLTSLPTSPVAGVGPPTQPTFNTTNHLVSATAAFLRSYSHSHSHSPSPLVLFRDTVNVFSFAPSTSLSYFWNGGAYFVCIATFVAVFLVPIVKVFIWIWYYYVPSDEVWRGRVLTFQDFVGKYMLAQVLIIGWMGVAIAVKRWIVLPAVLFLGLLPPGSALRVHLVIGLNLGDGLGSWFFVLTVLLSLIVGQFALTFHQYAFYWEEDRRVADAQAKLTNRLRHTPSSMGGAVTTASSSSTLQTGDAPFLSPYMANDTPYMGSGMTRHPAASSALATGASAAVGPTTASSDPLTRPLLRAIVEFGSSADLAGMSSGPATTSRHATTASTSAAATDRELRQPILDRIAQFGSRSNLAILNNHNPTRTTTTSPPPPPHQQPSHLLDRPVHPLVEAMCDRVHSPMHGVRLRWTVFGKALVLFFLFLLAGLTLATLSFEVCQIKRQGVIEFVTVPVQHWTESYSIISLAQAVGNAGYKTRAVEQQLIYVLFLIVVPLARLLMLAYLWLLPLTVAQQKAVFDTLEIASAWSSLDVFWVVMIIMDVELETITEQLTSLQTPKVAELLDFFFGGIIPGGFLGAQIKLLPGFWLLTTLVILEKIVFYLVTEQAVTAMSERQAEALLRDLALSSLQQRQRPTPPVPPQGPLDPIPETPLTTGSAATSPPWWSIPELLPGNHLIADATEGLLETNAALFFSPAARYTFAPKTFYSGLPRFVWAHWFVALGLLADADRVYMYGSASPTTTTGGGAGAGGNTNPTTQDGDAHHPLIPPAVGDDFTLEDDEEAGQPAGEESVSSPFSRPAPAPTLQQQQQQPPIHHYHQSNNDNDDEEENSAFMMF